MDKRICVYEAGCTDFSGNGLGCISPTRCTVHWEQNGEYNVELEHPIDSWHKYERLMACDRTIVVPVPEAPAIRRFTQTSVITAEVYTIIDSVSRMRLRAGPGTSHRVLAYYKRRQKVTLINKTSASWYEVTAPDGRHGWMAASYLRLSGTKTVSRTTTELLHDLPSRPQPFDIYSIDPGIDVVKVKARHVFYRLAEDFVASATIKNKTAAAALDAVFAAAEYKDHGFTWYADTTGTETLEDEIKGRSITDILTGDNGICATYGLTLCVDWFDIYLVKEGGADRGVQIRYAKNLSAIEGGFDWSQVVTRVVPVGQTKDGDPLYLSGTRYVESANAALYTRPKYGYLSVSDAKIGGKVDDVTVTKTSARSMMRKAAQAQLDGGCDLPACSLQVKFAQLRYDPAYAAYAALERICPNDTLTLIVPMLAMVANLHVVMSAYDFDALAQRYDEITLGTPSANLSNTGISSRQLGSASVTSAKLAPGSVGTAAMQPDSVSYRHVQAGSINTDALQAGCVTALKIASGVIETQSISAITAAINQITAGTVSTDTLAAAVAQLMRLIVDNVNAGIISAGEITTDTLGATLAQLVTLSAGTADFDLATVRSLLANALVLQKGAAGQMMISNLAVTSANILSATLGELVLTGTDGNYYALRVGSDGVVSTEQVSVTTDELTAGQTADGRQIVATSVNADSLSGATLAAVTGTIDTLLTDALTAGQITASQAMLASASIPTLSTTAIDAIGKLIRITADRVRIAAGSTETLSSWFDFSADGLHIHMPAYTVDGVTYDPAWSTVTDNLGFHVVNRERQGYVLSCERDRVKAGGMQIGEMVCRKTATGGWVWTDPD